jgi:hypothetical protein
MEVDRSLKKEFKVIIMRKLNGIQESIENQLIKLGKEFMIWIINLTKRCI